MYSSVISKIEKARRYALEQDRLTVVGLSAQFRGDHDTYTVTLDSGAWNCTCSFFAGHGTCSHSMAAPRMLERLLPDGVRVG